MRYAAVGGDSGFEAGELCFAFGVETGGAFEGEMTNIMKPTASRAASMRVMGLARRIERAMAMVKVP